MKFSIGLVLPNRWRTEGLLIRVTLFTLIMLVMSFALESAYALGQDKGFLLSGFVAILAVYWVPPIPKETYANWTVTHMVVLFGAYLSLFKIPLLFSSFLSYRLAQVLCISLYSAGCWLLIRRKDRFTT
jgi:hypothetical protein